VLSQPMTSVIEMIFQASVLQSKIRAAYDLQIPHLVVADPGSIREHIRRRPVP
jgi:hypothetical protein